MRSPRDVIYRLLPRPQATIAPSGGANRSARQLLILSKYPNPTASYYLDERAKALGDIPVVIKGLEDDLSELDSEALFVVICRYIKKSQLRWLERNRGHLAGVAYFVDDDIASVIAGDEAGWLYKSRLLRLAVWPLPRLNRLLSHVWVSTEPLATALANSRRTIDILRPLPATLDRSFLEAVDQASGSLRMVYHATGVHRHEHEFLMPIVRSAMSRHGNLRFEVVADGRLARQWLAQGIDETRLTISRPLSWPAYLAKTTEQGADIALVPLLPGRTNDSRSDTKRIDISRLGAAAIFSRCATFSRCAVEGEIHVENTVDAWMMAIDKLVNDHDRRMTARNATTNSIEKMRASAGEAFPGVYFDRADDMA